MTGALAVVVLMGGVLYTGAARQLRRRGDAWPRSRDGVLWLGGLLLMSSVALPWEVWLRPFTGHMASHVVAGMAAPVLVVLARPLTLALRVLPVPARRFLVSTTRSAPAAVLFHPAVAAAVDLGGLWALYRAPLPAQALHSPLLSVHLFVSGTLFTFTLLALDPLRHRVGLALRGGTLLVVSAAHAVLAKSLWVSGPPGTAYASADLHLASQVMYYGGDLVEIALAVVLAGQWYRAQGRALVRERAAVQGLPRGP
ncbi:cytochrome c oxidase assembly protein [Streptomyces sp. NPDC092369]|uniref:cytochrome c oxidase assembly protein n=1 Tax=Streptomyces sp. NPDC092369 TaxID=3366015 RepID=UPI00382D4E26